MTNLEHTAVGPADGELDAKLAASRPNFPDRATLIREEAIQLCQDVQTSLSGSIASLEHATDVIQSATVALGGLRRKLEELL